MDLWGDMYRLTLRTTILGMVVVSALTGCHAATPSGLTNGAPTSAPTGTPTRRATPTPQPTVTATATATVSPTLAWGRRPTLPASRYGLLPWTASDLQRWVDLDLEPYPESDLGRYDPSTDGANLKVTLRREIVARFATAPEADAALAALIDPGEYGWADSIPAEPFRVVFEMALNDGDVTTFTAEGLTHWLEGTRFGAFLSVRDVLAADNVLGNGEPGWVIDVRDGAEKALPLAIAGRPGHFQVVSPQKEWSRFAWSDHQIYTHDLNANGVPELAVWGGWWGTGMSHFCVEDYAAYEWNGSAFANLTPGLYTQANTDSGDCVPFEITQGPDGTQALTTGNRIASNCEYNEQWSVDDLVILRRYEWNGSTFALKGTVIQPAEASAPDGDPINPCALTWVNEAGVENTQARELLPQLLDSGDSTLTDGFAKSFGPAWHDYFTLKLGMWQAMLGDASRAAALLEAVRDAPAAPKYTTASELAAAFLDAYRRAGPLAGCAAVNAQVDLKPFALEFPIDGTYYRMGEVSDAWGFYDSQWALGGGSLWSGPLVRQNVLNVCNLDSALRLSIQWTPIPDRATLEAWLMAREIPYSGLVETDLNADGRKDWVFLAGTENDASLAWWAVVNRPGSPRAIWLRRLDHVKDSVPTTAVTFSPDPHGGPVTVLQWPSGLMAFRLIESDGSWLVEDVLPRTETLAEEMQLGLSLEENAAAYENRDVVHVHFSYSDVWDDEWMTLAWGDTAHALVDVDSLSLRQAQQIAEVERLLFDARDPASAATILDTLLDNHEVLADPALRWRQLPRWEPYLWYLRGVAAEAQGQDQVAIEAYWTVWDRFPTHPLAAVAQNRLDP